jgi:hypothetical protein
MSKNAILEILEEVGRYNNEVILVEVEVFTVDGHFVTKRMSTYPTNIKEWIEKEGKKHQRFTLTIK